MVYVSDSRNITCFLCDHIFKSDEESWMIFEGGLQRSLSKILSSALRLEITEKTERSIFLCNECKTLTLEYDSLEQRFIDMRKEIRKVYNRTSKFYNLATIPFDRNLDLKVNIKDSDPVDDDICSENADKIALAIAVKTTNDEIISCYLCYHVFKSDEESWMIFEGGLQRSLSKILSSALRLEIIEKTAHSIFLCNKCKTLTLEYGSLEQRFNDMRKEILNVYNQTTISFDRNVELGATVTERGPMDDDGCSESTDKIAVPNTLNTTNDEVMIKSSQKNLRNTGKYSGPFDNDRCSVSTDKISLANRLNSANNEIKIKTEEFIIEDEHTPETNNALEADIDIFSNVKNGADNEDIEMEFYTEVNDQEKNQNFEEVIPMFNIEYNTNLTETNAKMITCDICDKKFINRLTLDSHIKYVHSMRAKTQMFSKGITSKECDETFQRKFELFDTNNYHIERECGICNEKFLLKEDFAKHVNIHVESIESNKKDEALSVCSEKEQLAKKIENFVTDLHKCVECHKFFCSNLTLGTHMRKHKNIRYPGDICTGTFASPSGLSTHKRILHLGHSYTCNICNRKFASKSGLCNHQRILHLGLSYTCDICNRKFASQSGLHSHKSNIHLGHSHTCNICNKKLSSPFNLKRHSIICNIKNSI